MMQLRSTFCTIFTGLLTVIISEPLGIYLGAWKYGEITTLPTTIISVKIESLIYVFLGSVAVSGFTQLYIFYEDHGITNNFLQGLKDLVSAKYAIWKSPFG